MNTKVSIIMPCYNSELFIGKSIESVISQTYKFWELIIVDDCSIDGSVSIVGQYSKKDTRIKLIKLPGNSGAAIARNTAISSARGRYIAFLDSDDIWLPDKLERQIKFMEINNYIFTYSYYRIIDENNTEKHNIIHPPLKVTYNNMLRSNHIPCLTVMYDSQKIGKVYMPEIRKRQDYGLWLSILKKVEYAYCVPEILCLYRKRTNSISSNKLNLLKDNWIIFRNLENFSIIKSFYYLCWNIVSKLTKG